MVSGTPLAEIGKIIPYENNARINDHVVPALMESIKRFGFNEPIVLTKDNVIICGHTRVKAAQKLGMKKIPCVYAEGLTEEEINAYRLADNKVAEKALWDFEKLNAELEKIGSDIKMEDFGFDASQIEGQALNQSCATTQEPLSNPTSQSTSTAGGFKYKEQFGVIVMCKDECHQENVYNKLVELGYDCKVVAT